MEAARTFSHGAGSRAAGSWVLPVLLLLAVAAAVRADDSPHLEFVRRLRERGDQDLAHEYLQRLAMREGLPDDVRSLVPLELIRSEAALAQRERDAAVRDRRMAKVRKDLEALIQKDPQGPVAVLARLALGEMLLEQGQARLLQSRYQTNAADRKNGVQAAIERLAEAERAYGEALPRLAERWRSFQNSDPKTRGDRAFASRVLTPYATALYGMGQTLLDKATALDERGERDKSSDVLNKASGILDTLSSLRDQHPLGWQGYALFGRCNEELDKSKSEAAYKQIMSQTRPEAAGGKRLVRFYRVIGLWQPGGNAAARQVARKDLEAWLADFSAAANTIEGQQVRFLLAVNYLSELEEAKQVLQKNPAPYQNLLERTVAMFDALERSQGALAPVAQSLKYRTLRLSGRTTAGPVAALKTFDECLLRAEAEREEADDAAQAEAKTDAEREGQQRRIAAHHRAMLEAARRALALVPQNVRDEDLERAYRLILTAYLRNGDELRAAVILDHLAHHARRTETAQQAANAALQLYQDIATRTSQAADVERLYDVARLLERKWPQEPTTDAARRVLGFMLAKQDKLREAAQMWEKVGPGSPLHADCSYRAGLLYWTIHAADRKQENQPWSKESPELARSIALLERSLKAFAAMKPEPGRSVDRKTPIQASLALAEILARVGRHRDALEIVDPLADRIGKKDFPADLPAGTDSRILGLALRGNVEQRNISRALVLLEILQKTGGGEDQLGGGMTAILRDLGDQLRSQLAALERHGPSAQDQLARTRDSFREFLLQLEKSPRLTPDLQLWVGANYLSIGEYARAAQLFGAIQEPKDPADSRGLQRYQESQLQRIRALRLAAAVEPDPARRGEALAKVETELTLVMKQPWAARHLQFVQEQTQLVQDQGRLSGPDGAIARWDRLLRSLEPHLDKGVLIKSVYAEAQYQRVVCMYEEARQLSDPAGRRKALARVVQAIMPLRRNDFGGAEYKVRFEDFLARHADLKAEYDRFVKEVSPP